MFPPSLQKNIRELDRQISLLETECDNIEAESSAGKVNSSVLAREKPAKLFAQNSCPSHPPKMLTLPPVASRTHPSNCTHNRATHKDGKCSAESAVPENKSHLKRSEKRESSDGGGSTREGCSEEIQEMANASFEGRKSQKGSGESSDDAYPIRVEINSTKQKNASRDKSAEPQIWCELVREKVLADKCPNRKGKKKTVGERESLFVDLKFSSDEEWNRSRQTDSAKNHFPSGKWTREFEPAMTSRSRLSTKRRPRSVRTRKKSDEVPVDVNFTKAFHEKEIQCILWNEDTEKSEFLQGLKESIRLLQLLMNELKTRSARENKNEVLNDIQNILSKLRSINALQDPLNTFFDVRSMEGEENFVDQRKALLAVRKFCQELSEEKSALTDELSTKNCKISNLKSKEKEYLALISNLKFNVESLREEIEEGKIAKRDLDLVKAKLREKAKVIEVLEKSHGKMQALVEHYVLENDKLRAEVKMVKLESQKFHVLLSGKDVEISKYKQELELFQRQISQQLNLLRSKATEKEVEHAMEMISAQASILQTEVESMPSETTFEKVEQSLNFDLTETASSIRTQVESRNAGKAPPVDLMSVPKREKGGGGAEPMKLSSTSPERKDVDPNQKDGGFTSCKSDDSLAEGAICDRKYSQGLRGVLSSSKNLRSSVNEMLQDMRRGSTEKFWLSPPNSSNSSPCSVVSSYSENVSECGQRH